MKIAIISDSHDVYNTLWEEKWKECKYCFHVGDFITNENYQKFVEWFGQDKFFAVQGNLDEKISNKLSKMQMVDLHDYRFCLIHNKAFAEDWMLKDVNFLISGHTHCYQESKFDNIYCINPGSIGDDRGHGKSFVILTIEDNGDWKTEKIQV